MSNKKDGTSFENEFATRLSKYGFWVHLFQQNVHGQPADVIAVKNGKAYLIDCKNCERDFFDTNRVELNQDLSMSAFEKLGNTTAFFAIKISTGIYMISFKNLKSVSAEKKRLSGEWLRKFTVSLEKWVTMA